MASTLPDIDRPAHMPLTARAGAAAMPARAASRVSGALLGAQSDARLMRLAGEGYEGAFDALVRRHSESLRRYCRRFVSDAAAEDVVQHAFLALWRALREQREIREVRPWLYRVVHNGAISTIRQTRAQEQAPHRAAEADSPEALLERSTRLQETLSQLASLPDQQREAIVQSALDGRSRAQIATAMGLSDGAVGQLIYRARYTLRQAVTAVTPLPLAAWAASASSYAPVAARVTELATAGAGGGLADLLIRGGATLAVIAASASVPIVIVHGHANHHGQVPVASAPSGAEGRVYPDLVSQLQIAPMLQPAAPDRALAGTHPRGGEHRLRTPARAISPGYTAPAAPAVQDTAQAAGLSASATDAPPAEAPPPPEETAAPTETPAAGAPETPAPAPETTSPPPEAPQPAPEEAPAPAPEGSGGTP